MPNFRYHAKNQNPDKNPSRSYSIAEDSEYDSGTSGKFHLTHKTGKGKSLFSSVRS